MSVVMSCLLYGEVHRGGNLILCGFRASCKSPEQASLKVTSHCQYCQSPLIDMKCLLGSYTWIWRPIHLPPVVIQIQVNHLMTYFKKKVSHKLCLCGLCPPLPSTLLPISETLAKLTYAVNETCALAHNKWKPKTLNRASTEQEGLQKNN